MNARREQNRKIQRAMTVIERFGQAEGGHHKAWVIDQVARELVGNHYPSWVEKMKAGGVGPDSYSYDEGIAP